MDDIARNLSISKKTLYQYVKSKDELVEKVLDYDFSENVRVWIHECPDNTTNAIDQLLNASKYIYDELKDFNPAITFDLQKYHTEVYRNHMIRKQDLIYELMKKNIVKGISEGLYRENVNSEIVARLYANNLEALTESDLFKRHHISLEMILEIMFENHIRAIATPKGVMYLEDEKLKIRETL
jgi:AcrR family transcriptional regulator